MGGKHSIGKVNIDGIDYSIFEAHDEFCYYLGTTGKRVYCSFWKTNNHCTNDGKFDCGREGRYRIPTILRKSRFKKS